jgi:hypothetical protein
MSVPLTLNDLRRAWQARDPQLAALIVALAGQAEQPPKTPVRDGAPRFTQFLSKVYDKQFRKQPHADQARWRIDYLKLLEAPDAEVPLDDRLQMWAILLELWHDNGPYARAMLLEAIDNIPLQYGPWRALKRIFKEAEAKHDTEMFAALAVRFDRARANGSFSIGRLTLDYLVRRSWRFLRRLGQTLPAAYPDVANDFLARYPENTSWVRTWIPCHVMYHGTKQYNINKFTFYSVPKDILKDRAYPELWQRSPRPLFALLERAQADHVRKFAVEALKADFRAALREVEPSWVARLVKVGSQVVDGFVVWILGNVPRFEQASFRELGLHDAVLQLFDSQAHEATTYAANYARTHARDLPIAEVVLLASHRNTEVTKLVLDLLKDRDPRKGVGLDAWGKLLETSSTHELAGKALRDHFGAKELTPEWFRARLLSTDSNAVNFATKNLTQVHAADKLGAEFFADVYNHIPANRHYWQINNLSNFLLKELGKFDPNSFAVETLQRLFLNGHTYHTFTTWVNGGKLKPQTVPLPFWKAVVTQPTFETEAWIANLKSAGPEWARSLSFDINKAQAVLSWLGDPRRFRAADLGQEWLLSLVDRSEDVYHEFATEVLSKAFTPADFAPAVSSAPAASGPVDLGGASFLFTGKMATMKRDEAEAKVREAKGAVAKSVGPKLHYFVIGDEGSPLYGHGKKGDKQTKAEQLNAAGGNIRIISETAFLQMLAGAPQTVSADAVRAGCERLWQLAIAPGANDARRGAFARKYFRRHIPAISQAETSRPVDPGAEIPADFVSFDRVLPLFGESRQPLRDFAILLSKYEFARWQPPLATLVRLSELPYSDVRKFVAQALLADDKPEHKLYRIDPNSLQPATVYSFCESVDEGTRLLGMQLIEKHARLQVPEELFRLAESPDRRMRGFVIRTLSALYRDRGITADWKPYVPSATALTGKGKPVDRGPGVPKRPEQMPAGPAGLYEFLRRILFEIPPGRPPKSPDSSPTITQKLKPLPTRQGKLALVEVLRDLALRDDRLAGVIQPLLTEFLASRGANERAACLVAVTRIRVTHAGATP